MRPRQHNFQCEVLPTKRPPVVFSLHAPGIRANIPWAVKKRRSKSPALTAAAQLGVPNSGSRLPATDTSAGSSHDEEYRRQNSDTGGQELKCFYRKRKKVYTRRKIQHSRVSTAAAVGDATSILPENNCEVKYEINGQGNTNTAATGMEESEESAPPSASLNAGNESRSRRRTRELPPPSVSTGVAGTVGNEDRTNGKEPEATAAAAAVGVGRSQRQRKPKQFKDYVDTGSARYDWMTYYPTEPFPGDNDAMDDAEQLGEVEPITTVSEGGSSDILDNADKPFSLKLQTDIQKTRKARRILIEDSSYYPSASRRRGRSNQTDYALPAAKAPAAEAATAPALPKEVSSSMCPLSSDKFQESNGECEGGNRTPTSPTESAAAAATTEDDKDSCWIPSDDDSLRNAGTRFHEERVTFEFKVSGPTRDSSRLLNNGFPDSMTFKAKVKLKKKRPRPKVWKPEKVKVAKPVKVPEKTFERKQHRPARGAFEHDENPERAAAAREHSLRASALARVVKPASDRKAQSRKRRRQNERANPATNAADSASVPTTADVPRNSVAAEANHSSMEMVSDRCTITVDLTSSVVPTVENRGPNSEKRAFCSSAVEQELPLPDPGASEPDLQHRGHLDASRLALNCGGVPFPDGSDRIDEPPSTPRGNTLAVLPASTPFLNSPSFAPNKNAFGGEDSSDCESEQTWCTPTRRKRSTPTQQTRRSILSAVESAAAAEGNDNYVAVFKPSGDTAPVNTTANQLVCLQPNSTSPFPLPLESDAQDEPLQLVVYSQKPSDMVVYQVMRPKIKYKPKVNLDPLTINTFERLMLQGGEVNDTDHADKDWADARKLWSGRAHHFNGIMRQVQGDRAFSKWGGSVLDSMVGAFLTQNVSDFLSSNAFMALRARFPAPEDVRTATVVSSEEQSSQVEEIILDGSTEGTRADFDLGTPRMAAELVPMEASIKLVDAAGIDIQQENASPMADAGIQDAEVGTEVSMTHTFMTSFSFKSQEETVTVVSSPARVDARGDPGQSDPYSLSVNDRSVEILESRLDINDLVIDLGAADLGATSVALGSHSSIETIGAPAGIPVEPPPVTETNLEGPGCANRVQGNPSQAYSSANQAAAADDGADGNHSDMAAQPGKLSSSSKGHSWLEALGLTVDKDTSTPDETEKVLAAALRLILDKKKTDREDPLIGPRVPLKLLKLKRPRNSRSVDINRLKTNVKLLSGGERANYELKFHYKLNSEQKVTWEALRDDVLSNNEVGRNIFTADSVDWEAVRRANVAELANVIKERGMNNILGGRIKSLLDRIHRDQDGSLDLEWVRKLSPLNAQNFLTSVRGLGIKSVECIRLLTLHHPSFPVDTNVGRIVVRLGWVPLEPLPEETQLHLLEMYPIQEQIQKYIWPRLCTLDQQTLYEFHYQLITFGKVFCTKSKPNCNACPMQSECKHYKSAYCSARPLLKGPEEPLSNLENQIVPLMSRPSMQTPLEECRNILMLEGNARASGGECVPLIEEPNSPEHVPDIEDISYNVHCTDVDTDYVELPPANRELEPSANNTGSVYVELNEASSQNVSEVSRREIPIRSVGQENEGCIEDDVDESIPQVLGEEDAQLPSQELVLLPPGAASFPAPSLKNVQRLRTVHYVYELPDHHPLLAKMDKRDLEDPCYYLLAIWNADEVPEAMPKISDDDASNPFASCQSGDESVRGTLLVPCRTAMKGSFPLNGTYFQVNEVFADHESSIKPIDVHRTLLWNLNRRFVYFGTSVTSIFKDMSREEIQCCFKKGYVCVRAFDQATRQPKLLASRLHQSGARIVAARAVGPKGRRASKSKVVL